MLRVHFLCLCKAPTGHSKNGTKRKHTLRFGRYATSLGTSLCLALRAAFGCANRQSCRFVPALLAFIGAKINSLAALPQTTIAQPNESCDARLHRRGKGQKQKRNVCISSFRRRPESRGFKSILDAGSSPA
jgi:hypothetical protein